MPEAARIRAMNVADVDRVMEIAVSLKDAPHWPVSAYLDALKVESLPRRISLVAENPENGAVLGFAMALVLDGQAELETIAVALEAQRQGTARQLFGVLLSELSQVIVTEVMLEVRASNRPALGLYQSFGFEISGCRPRYYADPVEDAVLMNLRLA